MLHTEEEAKQKWCPFAGNAEGARQHGPHEHWTDERCIASECMAWRGKEVLYDETNHEYKPDGMIKEYRRKRWKSFNLYQVGYCGLAGKPED